MALCSKAIVTVRGRCRLRRPGPGPQAPTNAAVLQYRLINNHREDQPPISARLTALTEAKFRAVGVPIPHQ